MNRNVFFVFVLVAHLFHVAPILAAEAPLVSIKVVQIPSETTTMLRVEVRNESKETLIVDRNGLKEPDHQTSKELETDEDGLTRSIHGGETHGSTGGRWTVVQLKRREPDRMITILAGETYSTDVEAKSLLSHLSPDFLSGEVKARFSFHDFLLSVGNQEATEDLYKSVVKAAPVTISWKAP